MFYLEVSHSEDSNCDLYCFKNLMEAIAYITVERLVSWQLSDIETTRFPASDYQLVEFK
jgi:hypothetical protein